MKQKPSLFFFLMLALVTGSGCAKKTEPSISVLKHDLEARGLLKAEKYEEALQNYYSIVETDPNIAGTHSNIGVILNMVQKPEEALKSLEQALQVAKETKDLAAEFAVQFNIGVYYGILKKIDEAIEHYQAALEIVPSSIEAKTNIELLVQQNQKGQSGEKSDDQKDQQNQSGNNQNQNDNKNNQDKKDQKNQKKDQKDQDKKDENKEGDKDKDKDQKPDDGKKRESSPKYKPRPFQGDQLSEGDVKKILGELRNQEQKIRANFEKKEKGKTRRNEKDW